MNKFIYLTVQYRWVGATDKFAPFLEIGTVPGKISIFLLSIPHPDLDPAWGIEHAAPKLLHYDAFPISQGLCTGTHVQGRR